MIKRMTDCIGNFFLQCCLSCFALVVSASVSMADTCVGHTGPKPNLFTITTKLNVNPDGTLASYAPGDHGFTYIANGVNMIRNGKKVSCVSNSKQCRKLWKQAEKKGFGPSTQEFCSFAIEVEPYLAGGSTQTCENTTYRRIIGNGKGKPKRGADYPMIAGGFVKPYVSMTALRHTVSGTPSWVDSATVPSLVVPTNRYGLLGAVAFVEYNGRSTFAVIGDTGPAFGEGSIALHQLLQIGQVAQRQPLGPIPVEARCDATELGLQAPFVSRPDYSGDHCNARGERRGATDIRAYGALSGNVKMTFLTDVKLPMRGNLVQQEITVEALKDAAFNAGFCPAS